MVGPSMTDEERDLANSRLRIGFVVLVAFSGALVALQAGGDIVFVGAGFVGGLVVGALLLVFLIRWGRQFRRATNRGGR
jgi:hypothetical protein